MERTRRPSAHQGADQLGIGGGIIDRQAGDQQRLGVENLGVLSGLVLLPGIQGGLQSGKGNGIGVELQHLFRLHPGSALHLIEILLHLDAHGTVSSKNYRGGL